MGIVQACTLAGQMEGPAQGLFSDFLWLAFAFPMQKNSDMSLNNPSQFLLSG